MAFHDPCLSTCLASPGTANGESIGATKAALNLALWEMCVGFSLMAFHDPCLSTCLASPGAANGESIGATKAALTVELSGPGVEGAV